jgi:hypothetical protein
MAAEIDCKNPTIVVVGHWNGAILNEPGWIARHLLDVPEGNAVDLQTVIVGNPISQTQISPQKQIWLFDTYGFSCNGQRLEFFSRDLNNLQDLYACAGKIVSKLPHTPKSAVGVNFNVVVSGDLGALTSIFETGEPFDALGPVRSLERTENFSMPEALLPKLPNGDGVVTQLNLTRRTDFAKVEINFNFHAPIAGEHFMSQWLASNTVLHWKSHALTLLNSVYGLDQPTYAYL